MTHHALKSLGLSSLILAGLLSMLSATACVASGEESPCALGDRAEDERGEGACDDADDEESAGEEAPSDEEDAPRPEAPASAPQALPVCSPFCDRI
ncbi:hypothetical protein BE21_03775 [Sorangium cellulosum]|uniref:Secreted protein n=1 Tax=Sorangium cellulosum TaxID=56 RepID=A0A150TJV7_SORCE|nr:hypothetical protein BE21_03775 [Sorangium cellulosum]